MNPLIDVATLAGRLGDRDLRVLDVRYSLADADHGRRAFEASHVPGAVFLHLDHDLSAPVGAHGGRHPLPDPHVAARTFGRAGIGDDSHVVVVDDGNAMAAARAWWMLRWLGHDAVQVLDGGMAAWFEADAPTEAGPTESTPATLTPTVRHEMVVDRDWLLRHADDAGVLLVDVRGPERYRGDHEPIDPVGGHIPGAINLPFLDNLEAGRFAQPDALRDRFEALTTAETTVLYCGSGVSAAQGLLALERAGMPGAKLYAGSWSDWAGYPDADVERGDPASASSAERDRDD